MIMIALAPFRNVKKQIGGVGVRVRVRVRRGF